MIPFGFVIVPILGIVLAGVAVAGLPSALKLVGLRKYVDDSALSLINAALIASSIIYFIFNLLRTIFSNT